MAQQVTREELRRMLAARQAGGQQIGEVGEVGEVGEENLVEIPDAPQDAAEVADLVSGTGNGVVGPGGQMIGVTSGMAAAVKKKRRFE